MIDKSIIHLWSNNAFHDEAYIVCNKKGLRQLRDELDRMLKEKDVRGQIKTMCNDGEGYDLHIVVSQEKGGGLPVDYALPYTEEYAKDKREFVVYPCDVVFKKQW